MRPALFALPALLAIGLASPAAAQMTETDITLQSQGQTMIGTLALPAGDPAPVVLLFHGFTGTRDELAIPGTEDGVFSRAARALAEAGYASLRVDFIGSGDSDGDFADTTYEGQIADGLVALEFLATDPRVKNDDIHIIGWSQGGLVAAAVAGRSDVPDAVALWAAVANPEETFTALFGPEAMAAAATTGDTPYILMMPWGAEVPMKQPYFDGIPTMHPTEEIASYAGPLFVAHGTLDTTVLPVAQQMFLDAHEGPEEAFTREMDHAFNVFTETATLDEMVAATIAFFDTHAD